MLYWRLRPVPLMPLIWSHLLALRTGTSQLRALSPRPACGLASVPGPSWRCLPHCHQPTSPQPTLVEHGTSGLLS